MKDGHNKYSKDDNLGLENPHSLEEPLVFWDSLGFLENLLGILQ